MGTEEPRPLEGVGIPADAEIRLEPEVAQASDQLGAVDQPPPENEAVQAADSSQEVEPVADTADIEASREQARVENRTPRGAPVPNAVDTDQFGDEANTVNLLEEEDAEQVQAGEGKVLVSPNDPVLGSAVSRWLERQAARDARLSPLVERLQYLPGVRLEFDADDPIFREGRPAEEPVTA